MLNKETFLGLHAQILRQQVPQWDAAIYLRVMSADERLAWIKAVDAVPSDEKSSLPTLALLARCLCDERGKRLFSDSADDLAALSAIDATVADQLGRVAMRMNGLNEEGREDIKKNWPAAEAFDSSSNSQAI